MGESPQLRSSGWALSCCRALAVFKTTHDFAVFQSVSRSDPGNVRGVGYRPGTMTPTISKENLGDRWWEDLGEYLEITLKQTD